MTPERAKHLLNTKTIMGNMRYAFKRDYMLDGGPVHDDGITRDEDTCIKRVWQTMPGHTCYYDALVRIANNDLPEGII